MIDRNGKHHPNYSCPSCRHRHPPGWTCAHAAEIAQLGQPRVPVLPPPPKREDIPLEEFVRKVAKQMGPPPFDTWPVSHVCQQNADEAAEIVAALDELAAAERAR